MNLHALLKQRAVSGKPVRVGLIGAGQFGSMFLAQARLIEGIQVVGVADLQMQRARNSLQRTGWEEERMQTVTTAGQINDEVEPSD